MTFFLQAVRVIAGFFAFASIWTSLVALFGERVGKDAYEATVAISVVIACGALWVGVLVLTVVAEVAWDRKPTAVPSSETPSGGADA